MIEQVELTTILFTLNMALWQYVFQILPEQSTVYDTNIVDIQDLEEGPYWESVPMDRGDFFEVARVLKKNTSWSKKIDLYGEQDSNCLEIMFDPDSNKVVSASFRIDFRADFRYILDGIIEFLILKGLVILNEKLEVTPLNCEIILEVVRASPQRKKYLDLSNNLSSRL